MSTDSEPPSVWHSFASLLPLFAALMLVASVAYDFSFLLALGLSLDEVPSGIAEHVRSALAWAPKVAISLALYAVVELFLRRTEGGLSEQEIIARSPKPEFTRKFRRSGGVVMWLGAIGTALLGPFFSTDRGWMFFSFLVLWGTLAFTVLNHPRMSAQFPSMPHRLLLVSPIFLSMVCNYGHNAGAALKTAKMPAWELTLKHAEGSTMQKMLGIRRFASFSVAVDTERRVLVVPNESILSARALNALDVSTLNICRWLELLCPAPPKE